MPKLALQWSNSLRALRRGEVAPQLGVIDFVPKASAAGLVYSSRLTGRTCICVYDRALPGGLVATPVIELARLAGFVDALQELNVTVIATP